MKNNVAFLGLCVATFLGVAFTRELPEFLHICKRTDPNLDACMTDSVEYLKPYLKKGVPEYNIPALEPLLLKELVAANGNNIKVTAKNVHVYGASDFTVSKLKFDTNQLRFNVDVDLPNIYIEGLYDVKGKILLLPIQGSGPMSGNFTNCKGAVTVTGQLFKQSNGEEHLKINDFRMKIAVGKGSLKLENLFGGEQILGDVVNQAINSNFDAFLRELQPLVEKALSEAFLDIANSILSQFEYDQLFPET